MCDYIIMPNSEEEVYSIVEDGTCLCQNTQEEILRWIVQHLPNVEFDKKIEIVRNCCGWEVYIKKCVMIPFILDVVLILQYMN